MAPTTTITKSSTPAENHGADAAKDDVAVKKTNTKKRIRKRKGKSKPKNKRYQQLTPAQKVYMREMMRKKLLEKELQLSGVGVDDKQDAGASESSDSDSDSSDSDSSSSDSGNDKSKKGDADKEQTGLSKGDNPQPAKGKPTVTPETQSAGASKRRDLALQYLDTYTHSRPSWKFSKLRQTWILQNLYYSHQLPTPQFRHALEYIKGLSATGRSQTVEDARAILRDDEEVPVQGTKVGNKVVFAADSDSDSEDEDDAANAPPEEDTTNDTPQCRAKKVLKTLKPFMI
ncbi:hypothetical protein BC832DRAFT_187983 [Gaertneriomyces semiglobifer]|nr:hypothetical protein BC832DRAFT_187983 [Gaertneriomyces semiglobifer]